MRDDLPAKLEDAAFRNGLAAARIDRRIHVELYVADYWEQIGAYVKHRLIDEGPLLDLAFGQIIEFWEMLLPVTEIRRQRTGPSLYENFEYLAVRARQWSDERPAGSYPKNLPRYAQFDGQRRPGSGVPG